MNYLPRENEYVIGLISYYGTEPGIEDVWEQMKLKNGVWYSWCGDVVEEGDFKVIDWQPLPRRREE